MISLSIGVVIVALTLYLLRKWALPKPIPGIPHRHGSSSNILGDIPAMLKDLAKTDFTWMQWVSQQMQELDSPIIQIFFPLKQPIVILGDYEEARDISMRRCPREFDRSSLLTDLLSGALPDCHILFRTNDVFKAHRRILQDLMSPSFLHNVAAPNIYTHALKLIRLWEVKASITGSRPFNAEHDIFEAALDAAFGFAFGEDFPYNATQPKLQVLEALDAKAVQELMLGKGDNEPVEFPQAQADDVVAATLDLTAAVEQVQGSLSMKLKWKLLSLTPRFRRAHKVREAYILAVLQHAVQKLHAFDGAQQEKGHGEVRCAVDHMVQREKQLAEKDGRDPDFFSPAMRGEMFGFIVGGHDTTSTTVAWGLKFLADNPTVQTNLRSALQVSFSGAKAEGRNPSPAEISGARIPYLDAVIEEILRCGGTTPGLDREAMVDTQVLGHRIPKGTVILMLTQGPSIKTPALDVDKARRSATYQASKRNGRDSDRAWSPHDIAEFRPERWLVPSGDSSIKLSEQGDDSEFYGTAGPTLAFGLGMRGCWGKRLAYLELRLYVTLIVWNFYLLPCAMELSGYSAIPGVTSKPKQCYVRLRKVDFSAV